jgi:hypothetical protein
MDITPSTPPMPKSLESVIVESQRVEQDALYSAKGHFEAARRWNLLNYWIGIPAAIAATLVSTMAGIAGLKDYATLAGVLALSSGVFTAIVGFLRPAEKAAAHHRAGTAFNALKNDARIFYSIECGSDPSPTDVVDRIKELNDCRTKLNEESPAIPRFAFLKGRDGIESGENSYDVDKRKPAI